MRTKTPWENYGLTKATWLRMDPDARRKVRYDHWYELNKKARNKRRRKKYHNDDDHRQKVLDGCKKRRPRIRKAKAKAKFEQKIAEAQEREAQRKLESSEDAGERGGGRKGLPRFMQIDGKEMFVHTSRKLALGCGRGQSTIRAWLAEGVLPGSTICIKERYYFSEAFISAVRAACKRVYLLDGNGSREVLAVLILEELIKRECTWVPPGKTKRVGPGNYPEMEAA